MDNIAKIRKAIERRNGYISVTHFAEELLSFLDTLSEEPDKSLEEEIKRYYDDWDGDCRYAQTARHFAEWGANILKNNNMTEHEEQIQFWRDKAVEYALSHSKGKPTYFRDALYCAYLQAVQDALRIRLM